MTTSKELAEIALSGQKGVKVPVGTILGGSWPLLIEGFTLEGLIGDARKTAEIFYQVNERLDADILTVGTGATALLIRALGGDIRFSKKGAPEIMSELVKHKEDLAFLNIAAALEDPAVQWLAEVAVELSRLVDDQRFIMASGRAPFTLAGQIFGLEHFLRVLHKDKLFAHKLLEFTTRLSIEYFKLMNKTQSLHGAFVAEPTTSGDVISRKCFEEFGLPYLTRVVTALKQDYGYVMLHICGNITDRLALLPSTGIDCLSIDTKVDVAVAKKLIGKDVCIAGNVDPVHVLEAGNPDQVYQASRNCLEAGAQDGGFILLPGCDLAAAVPEENVRVMVETAHAWQK